MEELEAVTDDSIDTELSSSQPVLLDFGADWCEPCKALEPTLVGIAKSYDGLVRVLRVDLDETPDIAERFGVMSIPTVLVVQNGVASKIKGPLNDARIREYLDAALAS